MRLILCLFLILYCTSTFCSQQNDEFDKSITRMQSVADQLGDLVYVAEEPNQTWINSIVSWLLDKPKVAFVLTFNGHLMIDRSWYDHSQIDIQNTNPNLVWPSPMCSAEDNPINHKNLEPVALYVSAWDHSHFPRRRSATYVRHLRKFQDYEHFSKFSRLPLNPYKNENLYQARIEYKCGQETKITSVSSDRFRNHQLVVSVVSPGFCACT